MNKIFLGILLIAFAGLCRAGVSLYPAPATIESIEGAGTLHVSASETNKIATAWQNPAASTNWTWTSDGAAITLTGYTGPADVVVPKEFDNLPVNGFGSIFSGVDITSIIVGDNVIYLAANSFFNCTNLTTITLEGVYNIGGNAFRNCPLLTSIYWGSYQDVAQSGSGIFTDTLSVTNYVISPAPYHWGTTWNGRPVVRLHGYFDGVTVGGTNLTDSLSAKVSTNDTRYLAALTNTPTLQQVVNAGGTATNLGDIAQTRYSVFKPGYMAHSSASSLDGPFGYMWWPNASSIMFCYSTNIVAGYIKIVPDEHEIYINYSGRDYRVREMLTSITNNLDGKQAAGSYVTNTPAGIAAAGGQLAETVVTGAVVTVTSGNRYFFTTDTNVTLTASLTAGQVVNVALLRNTATNSITAVCESTNWVFTGGSLTNTIGAGLGMTFGWLCDPITGKTNFYATAASSN